MGLGLGERAEVLVHLLLCEGLLADEELVGNGVEALHVFEVLAVAVVQFGNGVFV